MTITNVSKAVDARLKALQVNIEGTDYDVFVDVLDYPQDSSDAFSGYPSCTHFYRETQSDYSTVTENRRTINYDIFFYVRSPNKTLQQLYQEAYLITDAILNDFDKTSDLLLDGDVVADFVIPVPGILAREDTTDGLTLIGSVGLQLMGDVDVIE